LVTAKINNVPLRTLIDTGATVSAITDRIAFDVLGEKPSLQPPNSAVTSISGDQLMVKAVCNLKLQLHEDITFMHSFRVLTLPSGYECVIGNDILQNRIGCYRINHLEGTITMGQKEITILSDRNWQRPGTVFVLDTIQVPPRTEVLLPCGTEDWHRDTLAIFEPSVETHGLAVARSVIEMQNALVPVRILNSSQVPRTLYRNETLGNLDVITHGQIYSLESPRTQLIVDESSDDHQDKEGSKNLQSLIDNVHQADIDQSEKAQLVELIKAHLAVFQLSPSDPGHCGLVKHQIFTPGCPPIRQMAYRVPVIQREKIREHIQKMLEQDVIRPSCSPWASPVVMVKKKDGTDRFCVDYRKLNAVTKKDVYPLPRIDDILDSLGKSRYFTNLDLASGYWQIEMEEGHKEKTAFTTIAGLYEFNVLPFGLCNAPATFQRLMEVVLAGLTWQTCLVYIDDILVFSESFQDHLNRLQGVFQRLLKAGLKL
jgi:hypothetical protein